MRTPLLVGFLLCSGACAHTQVHDSQAAMLSATSQEEATSPDSCVRDEDALDQAPCPVQGTPEEVTRMTSLLQSQNETVSTADSTPNSHAQEDIDDMAPSRTSVAEDAP